MPQDATDGARSTLDPSPFASLTRIAPQATQRPARRRGDAMRATGSTSPPSARAARSASRKAAQWYLDETAESLIHGLTQAFLKRGLPRALLSDNGSAMTATETTEGLTRLSVTRRTTLPYSPHQNGKQESFWNPVEGRLVAMLGGQRDLTLALLNEATQAWVTDLAPALRPAGPRPLSPRSRRHRPPAPQ